MKYISSKYIISRVMRDFRLREVSQYLYDIHQWIGDAVELIGSSAALIKKSTRNEDEKGALVIKNHRVALPYDFDELLAVEYKGMRLPKGLDKSGYGLTSSSRTTKVSQTVSKYGNLTYLDGTPVTEQDFAHLPYYTGEYYLINKNYIQTSFETGHIKLHYMALPVDDCGLPYIVDEPLYKQAITWYVFQAMLLNGHIHPVITWEVAQAKWDELLPMAQNELKAPGLDDLATFKNMWVRMIPRSVLGDDFFLGGETLEMIDL